MRERGLWAVVLIPVVVSLLAFFAGSAVWAEDEPEAVVVSVDGLEWGQDLDGPLMASEEAWWPGQRRTAVLYVHNRSDQTLATAVRVSTSDARSALAAPMAPRTPVSVDVRPADRRTPSTAAAAGGSLRLGALEPGATVPVLVEADLDRPASEVAALDPATLDFTVDVNATPLARGPSLGGGHGVALWLAPVLVALGGLLVVVLGRRGRSLRWRP
jgi:hypothetical protein